MMITKETSYGSYGSYGSYEIPSSTMFHREYMGYEPLVNWDARPSGEQLGYEKLDFAMDIVDTWKWIHGRTPFANNS